MCIHFPRCYFLQSPDTPWGSELPDGSWNGIVGMVKRGEVEFGVSATILTKERAENIGHLSLNVEFGYINNLFAKCF